MRIVYFDCSARTAALAEREPAFFEGIEIHASDPKDEADTIARLAGADVAINGHSYMPAPVLEALAPTLKRIVFLGTGAATYVDMEAAARLGISVEVCRDYGSRTIAEFAFGMLLDSARQISKMDRGMRTGAWPVLGGPELKGKTLGVVGLGGIGKEMARIGADFGMNVLAWNRSPPKEELPVEMVSLETLFEQSLAVSLHVATTPETIGMIGADLLDRMPKGAILVNVARGELVDQDALCAALTNGPLGHAALDVFPMEPLPSDDPIRDFDNVTLTAHAAWNTPDAGRRLLEIGVGLARMSFGKDTHQ